MRRLTRVAVVGLTVVVLALCGVLLGLYRRTARGTREIPFSTAFASGPVGADWAGRTGFEGEAVVGETDDFTAFERADFAASDVHPEIRRFYERTAEYEMTYQVDWHRGFRVGAWLASHLTSRIGQLNLPGRSTDDVRHLESSLARVPDDVDPRGSVVWTRTNPASGDAVFVAIYATHEHEGVTYANVAVPLPRSNLSTVLRPEGIEADDGPASDGGEVAGSRHGVAFTTTGPGDGGLYLVTPAGPLDLPMDQSFRVWPASAGTAPESPVDDVDLVATHEMWLCGRQFLTIMYGISRTESCGWSA